MPGDPASQELRDFWESNTKFNIDDLSINIDLTLEIAYKFGGYNSPYDGQMKEGKPNGVGRKVYGRISVLRPYTPIGY